MTQTQTDNLNYSLEMHGHNRARCDNASDYVMAMIDESMTISCYRHNIKVGYLSISHVYNTDTDQIIFHANILHSFELSGKWQHGTKRTENMMISVINDLINNFGMTLIIDSSI